MISNPVGAEVVVAETEVFNAAGPGAGFHDLNLSAVIGARPAFVSIKCYNPDVASRIFLFRANGEVEFAPVDNTMSPGCKSALATAWCVIIGHTDNNGIIEWYTSAVGNVTLDVIAYVRQ